MTATKISITFMFLLVNCDVISSINFQDGFILDTITDSLFGWKIDGNFVYLATRDSLKVESYELPKDFNFSAFSGVRGLWALFPIVPPGRDSFNGSISLTYHSQAQLLQDVEIIHCIGGDAEISISFTGDDPLYTIKPSGSKGYMLTTTKVPLKATSRGLTVNGTLSTPGSFILIDRISGSYTKAPTTPTTTTTTTVKPQPDTSNAVQLTLNFFSVVIMFLSWNILKLNI